MKSRFPRVLAVGLLAAVLPACQEDQVVSPALSATCEARPASGPAPLAVTFLLTVSGAEGPLTTTVSYGDGGSSSNPDLPHTYTAAGSYSASFELRTATQSARCSTLVSVSGGTSPASGNQPPNAVFRTSPVPVNGAIVGPAPFTVSFNMCPTSDPEGDELFFEMDFQGDGTRDFKGITGFHCRADFTYTAGTWRPLLCVYDRDKNRVPLHEEACQVYTVVAQ